MLINARELPDNSLIEADVVIIGAGIAGIAIAREFRQSAKTVCVLESGGEKVDEHTQALCAGLAVLSVAGHEVLNLNDFLMSSRLRAFGGTGNIWGAKVGVLDKMDFAARPWIPHSGWPIDDATLAPFYEKAAVLLRVHSFRELIKAGGRGAFVLQELGDFEASPRQYSRLTGRGAGGEYEEFKQSITNVSNIRVYLHANVTELVLADNGRYVRGLQVACLNGRRHTARGSVIVLASGGLENARLLLASNKVAANGIGNDYDQVGRFFACHLGFADRDSKILFNHSLESLERLLGYRAATHSIMRLSESAQRRGQMPQFGVYFKEPADGPSANDNSVAQVARLVDQALDSGEGLSGSMVENFFGVEHLPNPESRLSLASAVDELGVRRLSLRWRLQDDDLANVSRGIDWFARDVGRLSQGRVKCDLKLGRRDDWHNVFGLARQASHHIGTTRMHSSSRQGVVDRNCRLHSVENLFVAGCSVFPTMGALANPTFTIVALALRLSEHLKTRGVA